MTSSTAVVPMNCEALVVNAAVQNRDQTRIWQFNYKNLESFSTPEPNPAEPGVAREATQPNPDLTPGVRLHWTLPDAFRAGQQDPKSGSIIHPLVPNRWLVLRLSGSGTRSVKAILVESDCPITQGVEPGVFGQASRYLVDPGVAALWKASSEPHRAKWAPKSADVPTAQIGVQYPLDGWTETAAEAMFLTAVAPANPAFSGYFPHHTNVFGIYDDLSDVGGDTILSYYVVGWCSDPQQDIAGKWTTGDDFEKLLTRLKWTIADSAAGDFKTSLCVGACFSIDWQNGPGAAPPSPDPLYPAGAAVDARSHLNFATGNTVVDAFTALTHELVKDDNMVGLLRAFNYDQLRLLNQPNGGVLLDQRMRRDWFGSSQGGYRWTIVERNSDGKTVASLSPAESAALQQLNLDQASLDAALADVHSLQWTVNALWYKSGYLNAPANAAAGPPPDAPASAAIDAQLDPDTAGTAAKALVDRLRDVRALLGKVPQPDWTGLPGQPVTNRADAFAAGIAAFAAGKGLDLQKKQLKAVPSAPFWQPGNPVVVISGVQAPYAADPSATTEVRLLTQVSTAVSAGGTSVGRGTSGAAFAALPALANLPTGVADLVDELFLLDPANAAALALPAQEAPAYDGVLPAINLTAWSQPWAPLFLEWKGEFLPVPGSDDWSFDGTDYRFAGAAQSPTPQFVGGRSLLSPHAQFLFGSRLKKFIDQFGAEDPELKTLYDEIGNIYGWEFLAQELVGFGDTLTGRDARPFRRPPSTETVGAAGLRLADLLGYDDDDAGNDALPPAMRGQVTTVPLIPNGPAIPFQGNRQGQFYFTDLYLYDRFGRKLILVSSVTGSGVNDYKNFPGVTDAAMTPTHSLAPDVDSVLELPPRILQPMRLDAQLVDKVDDKTLLSVSQEACPVCAWVVANHLNDSLMLFAPDGSSWGDVRLVTDGKIRTAQWGAPAHGAITSLDQIEPLSPHLAAMLGSPALTTEANFTAFLSAIDSALWTIDPLGGRADQNLSVLIGRPLALVRLRLQFQLAGRPRRDTGWKATFDSDPPDFLSQEFAIRLGDQATRQDGAIGYFQESNFDSFHSVAAPDTTAAQTYVSQIGSTGPDGKPDYLRLSLTDDSYAFVTLLLDPRAPAHATTGLLPVQPITLPVRFVDAPLSQLEIGFRMGPVLSVLQPMPTPMPGDVATPGLTYPVPTERNGKWSWWEAGPSGPTRYDLAPATNNARFSAAPNSLREGVLAFSADLTDKE